MRSVTYFSIAVLALGGPALGQALENETTSVVLESAASPSVGVRIEDHAEFRLLVHGTWHQPENQLESISNIQEAEPELQYARRSSARKIPKASSARRSTYLPWVSAAEARHALPTGLLDALIWTESRYNPFAVSKAGAAGLGQLMPATAGDLGVHNRFNATENIDGAARYLRQMLDKFGLVHLAVAAYNAGPGAVARKKGIPANGETPRYVRSVLNRWGLQ
jgi:soluble lytic murein transglycosylase-like protein